MPVFLFTDIEGSTRLWNQYREGMNAALKAHDRILGQTIARYGGRVIEFTGDGVYAIFENDQSLDAVLDIQRQIANNHWGEVGELRVRMGLHGVASEQEGVDFFYDRTKVHGPAINLAARLMGVGWGGQILLTGDVLDSVVIPAGATIRYLGNHFLRSFAQPQPIYGLIHPDLPWQNFPPLRTLSSRPGNLPTQLTPFIGRQEDVQQIMACLFRPECSLLTLVGPGGTGKTRLAIEVASKMADDFPDGLFFVPLETAISPDFMVTTIANALSFIFYSSQNQRSQLLNYLQNKSLLLVMDNMEHLLAGGGLLLDILNVSANLKLIVTSRNALDLPGERVFQVGGLMLPAGQEIGLEWEQCSAVKLFLQAAGRSQPGYMVTRDEEKRAITTICYLVDGMPLGIELAAAWVNLFSCQEIANQIEQNLSFLTDPRAEFRPRQYSLNAVCAYFWHHLSGVEQGILRKLSVFRGNFNGQAAKQVTGASVFFLSALIGKAFLRKYVSPAGEIYYEMHGVLRQYAAGKFDNRAKECQTTQAKHAAYYAQFLNQHQIQLTSSQQTQTLQKIADQIENIRQAWNWAVENRKTTLLAQALESFFLFFLDMVWHNEGFQNLSKAVDQYQGANSHQSQLLLARLLTRMARFAAHKAQYQFSSQLLEQSQAIVQSMKYPTELVRILFYRGLNARALGNYGLTEQLLGQCLGLAKQAHDDWYMAEIVYHLGDSHYRSGHLEEARLLFWEALQAYRKIGNQRGEGKALALLGVLLITQGELAPAGVLLRESLKKQEALRDLQGIVGTYVNLGIVSFEEGHYHEAYNFYQKGLKLARELGNKWVQAAALDNLGVVALALKQYPQAIASFRESLDIALKINLFPIVIDVLVGVAYWLAEIGRVLEAVELLAFCLHHPSLDQAETKGRALKLLDELTNELPPTIIQQAEVTGRNKELDHITAWLETNL